MSKTIFLRSNYFFCSLAILFLTESVNAAIVPVGPPATCIHSPPTKGCIQTAIDAVTTVSGDTILLSDTTLSGSGGPYVEEVLINSKNLKIQGAGIDKTIIQAFPPTQHLSNFFSFPTAAPTFRTYCIIMVENPTPLSSTLTVDISDLTVDGSTANPTPPPTLVYQQNTNIAPIYSNVDKMYAIGFHNASGTITNVHTTNTKSTVDVANRIGMPAGAGISNASDQGTATFNVVNSVIDNYQRIGIDLRGSTLTANVTGTTINRAYFISGSEGTTPNGIQFSNSTGGSLVNSTIEANLATLPGSPSTGLTVFGAAPNLLISSNSFHNNDVGIAAIPGVTANNNVTFTNNLIDFTTTDGVNSSAGFQISDTNNALLQSNTMDNLNINMRLSSSTNLPVNLANNKFIKGQTGLLVLGNNLAGPVVTMNSDSFVGTSGNYIQLGIALNGAPNDIWPSTATVSFDGLVAGNITFAQFQFLLTKIFDKHNDPSLGLVLDFITPEPAPPSNFTGTLKKNVFIGRVEWVLQTTWSPSPTPGVAFYRIFDENGNLIGTVNAGSPLYFKKCFNSKPEANKYTLVAVKSSGFVSAPVQLRVV